MDEPKGELVHVQRDLAKTGNQSKHPGMRLEGSTLPVSLEHNIMSGEHNNDCQPHFQS